MNFTHYYLFDKPVPYKKLLFYPVTLKDYYEFLFYAQCLLLEKNSIKDPLLSIKAISMTYLEYLFQFPETIKIGDNEYKYHELLDGLLRIVLNLGEKDTVLIKSSSIKINEEEYDSVDFDNIKKIISEQNLVELPDEKIQKNVRESFEEARRFKQKLSRNKSASLEEQITALAVYSGWSFEYIYQMSYRKFVLSVKRANQIIMSNIYLQASMSGFVSFKDKSVLKSWIADLDDDDPYSDVKMTTEQLQSKANFEEAKKK